MGTTDTRRVPALSRRNFLGGMAATALSASALAGLTGCAPTQAAKPSSGDASDQETVVNNGLNPQDYDYTSNTGDLATLFSSWSFGPLQLSHRMVKSAAGSDTGSNPEEAAAYYRNFAKGGVEMVWVEDFVDKYEHFPSARSTPISESPLAEIVQAIHEEGSYAGYQISCMGINFSGTKQSASGSFASAVAADMTQEEIKLLEQDTVAFVKRIKELGFDACEINAAGNNIGQSFLSRMRNTRDDEYGPQNFENRTRFICETIKAIKAECGNDFPVQVLINGIEENDGTIGDSALYTTVAENKAMCKLMEEAGANSFHVRLGPTSQHVCEFASDLYFTGYGIDGTTSYGTQFDFSRHWEGKIIGNHSGCGMMLDVAAEIKEAVNVPVGTVTYMDPAHAPDFFENALKDGKADFLIMNRPLTVDPEYVTKLKEGRLDEIAPCTRCMHCHFDVDKEGNAYEHCRVNACTQHAFRESMPEGFDLPAAETTKNVMVVGAGPAGMEAARIAALRGHNVTLYEKKSSVGGMLEFASTVKGLHENLDALRSYMEKQLEVSGVKLVTEHEVNAAFIESEKPDALVLACGGLRDTLGMEGAEKTSIVAIEDFPTATIGENVVIVGSNAQAIDTALNLQAQGKRVSMVTPDPVEKVDKGQSNWVKTFVMPMLYARGMRLWPNATINEIGDGAVTITSEAGATESIACDTVIEAMDMLPNSSLLDGISVGETYAVGDCAEPYNIADAIFTGNLAGRAI